jgi:hypothetical protein
LRWGFDLARCRFDLDQSLTLALALDLDWMIRALGVQSGVRPFRRWLVGDLFPSHLSNGGIVGALCIATNELLVPSVGWT